MNGNRIRISLSVIFSSITALGLPLAAMLVIDPAEYGAFSLFYLIGASANILQLAVVSEAWARSSGDASRENSWLAYSNATMLVAIVGASVALVMALVVPEFRSLAVPVFIAILAQVYRNGSRFRAFRDLVWRFVLPGDALGAVTTLGATVFLFLHPEVTLDLVIVCWAVTRMAGLLGSRLPGGISPHAAFRWIRSHKRDIAVLGSDAAMGDMATIAIQYVLIPIMGLASLGTYRAVSNVGGPVRTVIFPLRPILSRFSHRLLGSAPFALGVAAIAAVLGLGAFAALWALSRTSFDLGTLNSLYPFAALVGLYIFAMVGDTVYSLIARQVVAGVTVVTTRITVSVVAMAGPVVGALAWGLAGAIGGYVLYLCFASVMWWLAVHRATRDA